MARNSTLFARSHARRVRKLGRLRKQVKGFSGAVCKSFPTMAEAEEFIRNGS